MKKRTTVQTNADIADGTADANGKVEATTDGTSRPPSRGISAGEFNA
jgi:hypothetical protein